MQVTKLTTDRFDIFIASEDQYDGFAYYYGGTRCVPAGTSEVSVRNELQRLQRDESGLKNALINIALARGALAAIDPNRFPEGFLGSRVGGARCILRPLDTAAAEAVAQPAGEEFETTLRPVFNKIGTYLNEAKGRIKLTPDFGRYAGLADLLHRHTRHVLGIRCEAGGCGGKASYSTTGVVAAFETLGCHREGRPVTLIGSEGAMGSGFLQYLQDGGFANVAVCDLVYDRTSQAVPVPEGVSHLPSCTGIFTRASLSRGGTIVAVTLGRELEKSRWDLIPEGTVLLLAHNLAVPAGAAGIRLMRSLRDQGVKAYPGQVLTLGGALTSRLEWFWRQQRPGQPFDKPLAHQVVAAVVSYLVEHIEAECHAGDTTPGEAMYRLAQQDQQERSN
jgi:hypothetical protein